MVVHPYFYQLVFSSKEHCSLIIHFNAYVLLLKTVSFSYHILYSLMFRYIWRYINTYGTVNRQVCQRTCKVLWKIQRGGTAKKEHKNKCEICVCRKGERKRRRRRLFNVRMCHPCNTCPHVWGWKHRVLLRQDRGLQIEMLRRCSR